MLYVECYKATMFHCLTHRNFQNNAFIPLRNLAVLKRLHTRFVTWQCAFIPLRNLDACATGGAATMDTHPRRNSRPIAQIKGNSLSQTKFTFRNVRRNFKVAKSCRQMSNIKEKLTTWYVICNKGTVQDQTNIKVKLRQTFVKRLYPDWVFELQF